MSTTVSTLPPSSMTTDDTHKPLPLLQRPPLNRRRFSSASVIAQITLLGYPPKIQPQSSATRDQGRDTADLFRPHSPPPRHNTTTDIDFGPPSVRDCTELDAVDQEAGCILIALANHDPNKVNANSTEFLTKSVVTKSDVESTSSSSSGSSSTSSATSTPTKSPTTSNSGNSMSISNLLGNGSLTSQQEDPSQGVSSSSENSATIAVNSNQHVTWQENQFYTTPDDLSTESDPIMILAAAAAAVNEEDENNKATQGNTLDSHGQYNIMRSYGYHEGTRTSEESKPASTTTTKRKWQGYHYNNNNHDAPTSSTPVEESTELYSEKRHRYHPPSENTWQQQQQQQDLSTHEIESRSNSTKNTFSHHYLSMKQNPRIKRNAMHAYITYMIYTDMTHARSRSDSKSVPIKSNYPRDSAASPPSPSATVTNGANSLSGGITTTSQYSPSRGYRFQTNDQDERTSSTPSTSVTPAYTYSKPVDPPSNTTTNNSNNRAQPPPTAEVINRSTTPSGYPTPAHTDITMQYNTSSSVAPENNNTNKTITNNNNSSSSNHHSQQHHHHASESHSWYHRSSATVTTNTNTSSYMPPPHHPPSSNTNTNDRMRSPAPPQPPNLSSTAIVDRPLTAFLWDDNTSSNKGTHSRQDSSIALPPLPFPKSSPSPRI